MRPAQQINEISTLTKSTTLCFSDKITYAMSEKKGRPGFPGAKQLSILFTEEDFERMGAKVQAEKLVNPSYAYSDLIRRYVHQGLAREARRRGEVFNPTDPKTTPKRQAFTIWKLAYRLARELKE